MPVGAAKTMLLHSFKNYAYVSIMGENHLRRRYLLSTVVAVTGFNPVTFNSMRRRNGLFSGREDAEGWSRYSLADICIARAAKDLIDAGINTQFAVDVANLLAPRFECMIDEEDSRRDECFENNVAIVVRAREASTDQPVIRFCPSSPTPLSAVFDEDEPGAVIVVNLYDILMRTLCAVEELGAETIGDAKTILYRVLAEVMSPDAIDNYLRSKKEQSDE